MIDWGSFVVVVAASLIGACGAVLLFALGLRFAGPDVERGRRALGVVCFVLCGLLVALGVCLVIPALSPFLRPCEQGVH